MRGSPSVDVTPAAAAGAVGSGRRPPADIRGRPSAAAVDARPTVDGRRPTTDVRPATDVRLATDVRPTVDGRPPTTDWRPPTIDWRSDGGGGGGGNPPPPRALRSRIWTRPADAARRALGDHGMSFGDRGTTVLDGGDVGGGGGLRPVGVAAPPPLLDVSAERRRARPRRGRLAGE